MEGTRCMEPGCGQHDFLPFTCALCGQCYCLEHRSRFVHSCSGMIGNEGSGGDNAPNFNQDPHRESVKSMMSRVENRFNDQEVNGAHGTMHYNVKSSSSMRPTHAGAHSRAAEKMAAMAASGEHMTLKQRNINNKTREMLLKSKAVGNPAIATEDRIYLAVHFTDVVTHLPVFGHHPNVQSQAQHHSTVFMYFNRNATVGEVLQQIWRSHAQMVKHSAAFHADFTVADLPHESLLLAISTVDTPDWRHWDRNFPVHRCLNNCEDIAVFAVPMQDAIRNQRELETNKIARASPTKRSARHVTDDTKAPSPPKQENVVSPLEFAKNTDYEKRQYAWYHRVPKAELETMLAVTPAELENSLPLVMVQIVGVHHDDYPNIYYTVHLVEPIRLNTAAVEKHGARGEGLIFQHEKQTDKYHLFPLINAAAPVDGGASPLKPTPSAAPSARTGNIAGGDVHVPTNPAAVQELQASLLKLGSIITLRAAYRKREITDIRIGNRSSIAQLKLLLGALFEIPVPDMKVICKGTVMKNNYQLIKDTKITNGTKLLVVSGTPSSTDDAWG